MSPRGRGSVGRASPCQGEGRGFESRRPLHRELPVGVPDREFVVPGSGAAAMARRSVAWQRGRMALDHATLAAAMEVVYRSMSPTPQYAWPLLGEALGAMGGPTEVWVKHENTTPTGVFKVRGGLVYVDRLVRERPEVARHRVGHARQPRAEPRVRRAAARPAGRDRGAADEQPREERGHGRRSAPS